MYYPNDIEDICYEQCHIDEVLAEIKKNIPPYFDLFIETEGGNTISYDKLSELSRKFGATSRPKKKRKNTKIVLERLMEEAEKDFYSDREVYQQHLDPLALEEYGQDVSSFKNTILRNQIPIIRKTLQNKAAKELDRYRAAFARAIPGDLFRVVNNIVTLAIKWRDERYNSEEFENIPTCQDMNFFELDEDQYAAFGVIGGGIKSHFLYKLYPEMYPNKSREAIYALWYLTNKNHFGCKQDSEFLMINTRKDENTTQQNYFYPYGLFAFYALEIYRYLKEILSREGINVSEEHRFIIVDYFLSFVSRRHQEEIDFLKQSSRMLQYDY